MAKILVVLLFMVSISSCKKYREIEDDANGNSYVRGRLFLYDTLAQNELGMPLLEKEVSISYQSSNDTLNHLFSTTTDKEGYFVFKNLSSETQYRVAYHERSSDSAASYSAVRENIKPPFDTLHLNAFLNTKQIKGVHYSIRDSLGAPVRGASVCIFGNASFFKAGNCENASYHLISDDNGHVAKFNIPMQKYYVTAFIENRGSSYVAIDTVEITNEVNFRTIFLSRTRQTGVKYLVMDSLDTPLPLTQLCFFTSAVLYNNANCEGSNFQATSDRDGFALKTDIAPGKYFVIASVKVDSLILSAKDTIEIFNGQIINDTVKLRVKK